MKRFRICSISFISLFAVFQLIVPVVSAQGILEEIVVTAQKREQSLQDVPISIMAVTGEKILDAGYNRLEDMSDFIPNVRIAESFGSEVISVRGVGSGQNIGFEQSVGTFIDGVYFGRGKQSLTQFLDVERVEILRGPQPTYFGQNTIGGALNITSRRPGDEWEGYVTAKTGINDEEYSVDIAYGGPITDTVGVRVAGRWYTVDGWDFNTITGDALPQKDSYAVRGTLDWAPNDQFDASFKVEVSDREQTGSPTQLSDCPAPPGLGPRGRAFREPSPPNCIVALNNNALFGGRVEYQDNDGQSEGGSFPTPIPSPVPGIDKSGLPNLPIFQRGTDRNLETFNLALTMNYQLGDHTLTSVTGYNTYDTNDGFDLDATPFAIFNIDRREDFDQISQELRISSPSGQTFEYMAGFYYQRNELLFETDSYFGQLPVPYIQDNMHNQEDTWVSVFAAGTYHISDTLRLNVGLRYTDVQKEAFRTQVRRGLVTSDAVAQAFNGPNRDRPLTELNEDDFNPSVGVEYDLNDDVMLYAAFAQGFKAGSFDPGADDLTDPYTYDAEEVDAFEIGAKTTLFDGSMYLNVSLYRNEFTDLQVTSFDVTIPPTGSFVVANAAAATIQGAELDSRWAVNENFEVNFSAAYLDATYDDFPGAACTREKQIEFINSNPAPGVACQDTNNLAGETTPQAPEWSFTIGFRHTYPLANGMQIVSTVDSHFSDGYKTEFSGSSRTLQDEFEKIDIRMGLHSADGKWNVSGYVDNATDTETVAQATDNPGNVGSISRVHQRGLVWGFQGQYNF